MSSSVKYRDGALRGLITDLGRIAELSIEIGVLGGTHTSRDGSTISLARLAAIHEFGDPSSNIPERSFLRRAFADPGSQVPRMTERLTRALLNGRIDPAGAFEMLGQQAVAEVKATIAAGPPIPPPLKPETIRRKGSSRPLIDTSQLINSITYRVIETGARKASKKEARRARMATKKRRGW